MAECAECRQEYERAAGAFDRALKEAFAPLRKAAGKNPKAEVTLDEIMDAHRKGLL